jgi:raffinose/stachyose/melibiose transport system substrate-binding protein
MSAPTKRSLTVLAAGATALALGLTGCAGSSGAGAGQTTISFLVDSGETSVTSAEALAKAFTAANPTIKVDVETRPGGSDGDNIVKTRLSTGDMTDVFQYNAGSLFQQISPAKYLEPITSEAYVQGLSESFTPSVSVDKDIYGVPIGTGSAGGVLYNKKLYEKLGLSVPKTWAEFMANNRKIKDSGVAPVIQTYKDTWTSQMMILADYANVAAADPNFAADYTANKAKFATQPTALKGFEHLEEVGKAGYLNKDFASATYLQGLDQLASGEGAQYPILTAILPALNTAHPDEINNIGLFPLPGEDASKNNLTVWLPTAVYIPKDSKHKAEAKKFQEFLTTKEACDVQTEAVGAFGPYLTKTCSDSLGKDVPAPVKDMLPYFEDQSKNSPALEYLSPVKGPALEQIAVEVGSGIRSAKDGAALYDEDVKKQAKQLNLPGWN